MSSSDLLSMKMKQIGSLKSRFSNTIEISKDSTFKIPLTGTLSLFISLPFNFPTTGPSYFIEGYNNHLLLPIPSNLSNWTIHTNLSNLTFEMFKHLNTDPRILKDYEARLSSSSSPPPPYGGNSNPNTSINNPIPNKDISNGSSGGSLPPYKDSSSNNLPTFKIPSSFPDLMNKSKEELEEFLASEDMLNAYLFSFDQISQLSEEKDKLIKQGEELLLVAETLQKSVDDGKINQETKTKLYQELKEEYNRLKTTKDSYENLNSHASLMEKLSDLIVKSELESDTLTNNFLDGTIELKEFRKKYKEIRMQYHSRCILKEKQQAILN